MANTFFDTLRRSPIKRGPERIAGGICGGIANKFGWKPAIVRIITLALFLLPLIGFGSYLILWLLLPRWDNTILLERLFFSNPKPPRASR